LGAWLGWLSWRERARDTTDKLSDSADMRDTARRACRDPNGPLYMSLPGDPTVWGEAPLDAPPSSWVAARHFPAVCCLCGGGVLSLRRRRRDRGAVREGRYVRPLCSVRVDPMGGGSPLIDATVDVVDARPSTTPALSRLSLKAISQGYLSMSPVRGTARA